MIALLKLMKRLSGGEDKFTQIASLKPVKKSLHKHSRRRRRMYNGLTRSSRVIKIYAKRFGVVY